MKHNDFINIVTSKINKINYTSIAPYIREILMTSINRNFQVGGRYGNDNPFGGGNKKWVKSKRAILQSGMTLLDTGQLAASIRVNVKFEGNKLKIVIGSNKTYAAQHQFGFKSRTSTNVKRFKSYTKSHKFTIPARPFIVIQNEDIVNIRNFIVKKIINNFG